MSLSITRRSAPEPPHGTGTPRGTARRCRSERRGATPSLRNSTEVIGEIRRACERPLARLTRLSRGERYAAIVHKELSRLSPSLGEELRCRLLQRLSHRRRPDIGTEFMRGAHGVLWELQREGLISPRNRIAIERTARSEPGAGGIEREASIRTPASIPPPMPTSPMSKGPTAALDAPSGFLWKPISDSTGLLVILLPESWSDNAATVTILSSDRQTLLAEGRPAGIGNGGRAHFRFDRPGGDFPPGVLIQVKFSDGSIREITVPSPLMRGEGR